MAQSYSDPIYGSLGKPKADYNDLTPEQKFEQDQRDRTPPVYTDDEDVTTNNNSVKIAEGIVGAKMAEPTDPKQVLKMKKTPVYELADSDDEEDDTVETRRSIKTAEKQLKHRFFINAKDARDFAKATSAGAVDQKILTFSEDKDDAIEPKNATLEVKKLQMKKEKAETKAAIESIKQDASLDGNEKEKAIDAVIDGDKNAKKEADEEALHPVLAKLQEIHKKNVEADLNSAKKEAAVAMGGPEEEAPKPAAKEAAPAEGGMDFLPPELAGQMEVVAAQKLAKQKIENDTNRAQQGLVQRDDYEKISM